MRVYLIDVNSYGGYSFGVLSLADALSLAGHEVRIAGTPLGLDAFLSADCLPLQADDFAVDLCSFRPDVIGISVFSTTADRLTALVPVLRRAAPRARIVVGGVHCLLARGGVLHDFPEVDFAFHGEAEVEFPRFLERLADGVDAYAEVRGLIYRERGEVRVNPAPEAVDPSPYIPERALWRHTSRALLARTPAGPESPLTEFFFLPLTPPTARVLLSRGCPYRCTFCRTLASPYTGMRHVSPGAFREHLRFYVERLGVRSLQLFDSEFNLNRRWAREVTAIIAAEPRILEWSCQLRPDLVDEGFARELRAARCSAVSMYPENRVDRIRNGVLGKEVTDEQLLRAFDVVERHGFFLRANVIVGNPGETRDEIDTNLEFLADLAPDQTHLMRLMVLPGTELARRYPDAKLYVPSESIPDALYDEIVSAMELHLGFFPSMIRRRLGLEGRSVLLVEVSPPDGEPLLVGSTTLLHFGVTRLLAVAIAGPSYYRAGCRRLTVAIGDDTEFPPAESLAASTVVRLPRPPLDVPLPDAAWREVRDDPPDVVLAEATRDEAKLERLVSLANGLKASSLVLVDVHAGVVFELDVVSKLLSRHEFANDFPRRMASRREPPYLTETERLLEGLDRNRQRLSEAPGGGGRSRAAGGRASSPGPASAGSARSTTPRCGR